PPSSNAPSTEPDRGAEVLPEPQGQAARPATDHGGSRARKRPSESSPSTILPFPGPAILRPARRRACMRAVDIRHHFESPTRQEALPGWRAALRRVHHASGRGDRVQTSRAARLGGQIRVPDAGKWRKVFRLSDLWRAENRVAKRLFVAPTAVRAQAASSILNAT